MVHDFIFCTPYSIRLSTLKSIIGFEEGGVNASKFSGDYDMVGLINPILNKDSHRYHINDKRVHMIYNPSNWGFPEVVKCQKKAAKIMLGNAVLLNIGHSEMPTEFFRRYGNYL